MGRKLADLGERSFIWFPRYASAKFFDRLLAACQTGSLSPCIVQEAETEATILSLMSAGAGVAFVIQAKAHWAPARIGFKRIEDLAGWLELHCLCGAGEDAVAAGVLDVVRQRLSERRSATKACLASCH